MKAMIKKHSVGVVTLTSLTIAAVVMDITALMLFGALLVLVSNTNKCLFFVRMARCMV